ncbi:MAG TPA: efflux RND transporter periplasmic adaptor subunit [Lacipirellulaceae bacterium]|nr:efflux RND transporter periplasmic adaptor subunit [Lacipirellulaceae bacterium]
MSIPQRVSERPTPPQVTLATPEEHAAPERRTLWQWLRQTVPTIGVIAVIAGLAAWGHTTDWTMPKFSALIGGEKAEEADWCDEHNVPESMCVECNPKLLAPQPEFGWCPVHGIMQCPFEHPELAQTKTLASVTPAMLERAQNAISLRPRTENNSRCTLHHKRIQFASAEAVEKVGVDIAIVAEKPIVEAVTANGEIVYDETRMAHFSSRVPGVVWHVQKQIGDRVKTGDVLAIVDAADVGRLKSELMQAISQYRLARDNVERLRPLAGNAVPAREFLEVQATADSARIQVNRTQQALVNLGLPVDADKFENMSADEITHRIRLLGLPTDLAAELDAQGTTSNLLPLRSSIGGIVVDRKAVDGEVVDSKSLLFDVADTSRLWLNLDVRQEDAKYVSLGQRVLFRASDTLNEPDNSGTVSWISTAVDDATRTVKVRVDLQNGDGKLRANTFGTGRIVLRDESKAIVVPSEAIHWDGTCNVVFVRDKDFFKPNEPKVFYVRGVRLGVKDGENTEIIAGVLPGEVIASKNSVVLEAQLLKSSMGAGCACCQGK